MLSASFANEKLELRERDSIAAAVVFEEELETTAADDILSCVLVFFLGNGLLVSKSNLHELKLMPNERY
jgi:hypothetical protein